MGLGTPELIIIFIVALVVFGPRKLPELGRSLGKSLGEFKRASNELKNTLDDEIRLEEHREQAAKAPVAPAVPPVPALSTPEPEPYYDGDNPEPQEPESQETVAVQEPVASDAPTVPRAAPELFDSRSR